jgi:epoxyqueuosine reductase QueG
LSGSALPVVYPKEVIQGISELPTQEYRDWYDKLNEKLDIIVTHGAEMLRNMGYKAVDQSREHIGEVEYNTTLPHKTVATRAGIGWIGKSALLVTDAYGSAIRLSSILTNAPLSTNRPINKSRCGDCMICANACPAGAVSGKLWEVELYRDEFFDPIKCRITACERAKQGFGGDKPICGKCIEICLHTQKYIKNSK